jgi:hypothetical protein
MKGKMFWNVTPCSLLKLSTFRKNVDRILPKYMASYSRDSHSSRYIIWTIRYSINRAAVLQGGLK